MNAETLSGAFGFYRDSPGQNVVSRPDVQEEKGKSGRADEALVCTSCLNTVTLRDHAVSINGSHTHTFFNPQGIVFELGCFREASGCLVMGEATSEFTWFPDSVWRFALCRKCGIHLGWHYELRESEFYGLILARLGG